MLLLLSISWIFSLNNFRRPRAPQAELAVHTASTSRDFRGVFADYWRRYAIKSGAKLQQQIGFRDQVLRIAADECIGQLNNPGAAFAYDIACIVLISFYCDIVGCE